MDIWSLNVLYLYTCIQMVNYVFYCAWWSNKLFLCFWYKCMNMKWWKFIDDNWCLLHQGSKFWIIWYFFPLKLISKKLIFFIIHDWRSHVVHFRLILIIYMQRWKSLLSRINVIRIPTFLLLLFINIHVININNSHKNSSSLLL